MAKTILTIPAVTLASSATYYFYLPSSSIYAGGVGFFESGTCQAGGSITTAVLKAASSAADNYYVGKQFLVNSGTAAGSAGRVTAYVGSTKTATFDTALSGSPDATTIYSIRNYSTGTDIRQNSDVDTFSWFCKFSGVSGTVTLTVEVTANNWQDAWVVPFDQFVAAGTRSADVVSFAVVAGNITININRCTYQEARLKIVTGLTSGVTAVMNAVLNDQPVGIQ